MRHVTPSERGIKILSLFIHATSFAREKNPFTRKRGKNADFSPLLSSVVKIGTESFRAEREWVLGLPLLCSVNAFFRLKFSIFGLPVFCSFSANCLLLIGIKLKN